MLYQCIPGALLQDNWFSSPGRQKTIVIGSNPAKPLTLQKKLLKTVFTIGNDSAGCDLLLIEVGNNDCCSAFLKTSENRFYNIQYHSFDTGEEEFAINTILNELKEQDCKRVVVSSSHPHALLVPNRYVDGQHSLVSAIYDVSDGKLLTDALPEWQLSIAYAVPDVVKKIILDKFESIEFRHAYASALKSTEAALLPSCIQIHFGTQHFHVIVRKENQVLLAQTYFYKTPLDVVYYLLKIFYEFGLEQSGIDLLISGLIDQDSAMYVELHHYFLNARFAGAPSFELPEHSHPQHYFTSLYNLAACVS